jgi:hypothetical protein
LSHPRLALQKLSKWSLLVGELDELSKGVKEAGSDRAMSWACSHHVPRSPNCLNWRAPEPGAEVLEGLELMFSCCKWRRPFDWRQVIQQLGTPD